MKWWIAYLLGILTPFVLGWIWCYIDRNILGNRCVGGCTTVRDLKKQKKKQEGEE